MDELMSARKKTVKPKPHRLTERERELILKLSDIFDGYTDDEMAVALQACIYLLGDRLAEKMENKQ